MKEKFVPSDKLKKVIEETQEQAKKMAQRIIKDRGERPEDRIIKSADETMEELNKLANKELPPLDDAAKPKQEDVLLSSEDKELKEKSEELARLKEDYDKRTAMASTLASNLGGKVLSEWRSLWGALDSYRSKVYKKKDMTDMIHFYSQAIKELNKFIEQYQDKI